MKLFNIFNKITENSGNKKVSTLYIKGILSNTTNKTSRKLLTSFINKDDNGFVTLTPKQYELFNLIKSGGFTPKNFSSKN
jgi:hypothetical protein